MSDAMEHTRKRKRKGPGLSRNHALYVLIAIAAISTVGSELAGQLWLRVRCTGQITVENQQLSDDFHYIWQGRILVPEFSSNQNIVGTPHGLVVIDTCERVMLLSWETGQLIWMEHTGGEVHYVGYHAARDQVLTTGNINDKVLRAFDASTGELQWEQDFTRNILYRDQGKIFLPEDGNIYLYHFRRRTFWLLDETTGEPELLETPPQDETLYGQYIAEGSLSTNMPYRIRDMTTDAIVWEGQEGLIVAKMVIIEGNAYGFHRDGGILQINLTTGEEQIIGEIQKPIIDSGPRDGHFLAVYDDWFGVYYGNRDRLQVYRRE